MTPAAKPSNALWVCTPALRKNSSGTAPTAVIMPAARLPRPPAAMGEMDSIMRLHCGAMRQETSPNRGVIESFMSQRAALPVGPNAASALGAARRVVVKIGSSLLIDAATRQPTRDWLAAVASDLAALKAEGREVIVVSSGSIALGRGCLLYTSPSPRDS